MDWDEYFLNIAEAVAKRSKDPSTQVGTVIVDEKYRPVSFGYNGLIQGADESKLTLSERPMKYYFSMHSEINAIIFSHRDLAGCICYSVYAPCVDCLRFLLQAGVTKTAFPVTYLFFRAIQAQPPFLSFVLIRNCLPGLPCCPGQENHV